MYDPKVLSAFITAKGKGQYQYEQLQTFKYDDLLKIIEQDNRYSSKVTAKDAELQREDIVRLLVLDQFVPIDEVAGFKLLPVKLLQEWTEKLGVKLDGIGNLNGGDSLC